MLLTDAEYTPAAGINPEIVLLLVGPFIKFCKKRCGSKVRKQNMAFLSALS